MRAYRQRQIDWTRQADAHVYLAQTFHELGQREQRDHHLRKALRVVLVHGAAQLRAAAKELLGHITPP